LDPGSNPGSSTKTIDIQSVFKINTRIHTWCGFGCFFGVLSELVFMRNTDVPILQQRQLKRESQTLFLVGFMFLR